MILTIVFAIGFCVDNIHAKECQPGDTTCVETDMNVAQDGASHTTPWKDNGATDSDKWYDSRYITSTSIVGVRFSFLNRMGYNISFMSKDKKGDGMLVDGEYTQYNTRSVDFVLKSYFDNTNILYNSSASSKFTSTTSNWDSKTLKVKKMGINLRFLGISESNFSASTLNDSLRNHLMYEQSSSVKKQKIAKLITLSGFSFTEDDFQLNKDTNSKLYDIFIVYEPLIYVNMNGKEYIGTPSELLDYFYGKSTSSNDTTASKCKDSKYGSDWCLVSASLYNYGSCSITLEGTLLDNISSTAFSSDFLNGYFNKAEYDSRLISLCDNHSVSGESWYNILKEYGYKSGGGALGAGVIWFDDGLYCRTNEKLTCSDVKKYFGISLNETITRDQANTLDYKSFNNLYKSKYNMEISTNWYCTNCGCGVPTPTPYNCTPSFGIGTCTTGTNTTYSDYNSDNGTESQYWQNCVFSDNGKYDINTHKWSNTTKNPNLTYFESALGDSVYCPVYCIESTVANLAKNQINALAGQYIVLQGSTVTGSRTCKTKNIDYDKFTSDLSKAKQEIIEEYVSYKAAESVINGGAWVQNGTCGETWQNVSYGTIHCEVDGCRIWDGHPAKFCEGKDNCKIGSSTKTKCTKGYLITNKDESSGECYTDDSYKTPKSTNWTWSKNGSNIGSFTYAGVSKTYTVNDVCQVDKPANPTVSTKSVLAAIGNQETYISRMESCYNWKDNNIYNLDVDAWIEWNLGIYSYNEQLDKVSDPIPSEDSGSVCDNNNEETYYTFNDGTLNSSSKTVSKCTSVSKTRESSLSFKLKSYFYNYIVKNNPNSNNFSVKSTTELGNGYTNSEYSTNYLKLNFGNLPVPFNLSTDTYHNAYTIKYVNLGHKKDGTSMVNSILSSSEVNTSGNYTNWSCDLNVTNEIFNEKNCSNGYCLNIIYREIDLARPFPNIDNSNRDTGENWADRSGSRAWDNDTVKSVILNNRNVIGSEIYNQTPMYTFIMTPSDIIEIRKYNNSNSYESYTGADGSKTYDYKCNEGTTNACISDYLTHLLDILDSNNLPGTCKDAKTRAYTDVASFNNCRY